MFYEYSMTNPDIFEEYVGFTEPEVMGLCEQYQMDLEEMMNWYDGIPNLEVRAEFVRVVNGAN